MAVPVSELQTPNIDNIVELFQLELNTTIHGVSQTYYFHNGVGINNDANLIFANNEYTRMPIEACLLYTSPSPRDKRQSRMPSSA